MTTNNNNIAHHHQAVTNFSPLTNQSNADNVQTLPSNDCNNPNNNHSLVTTAQGTSSSHSSIKKDQHPQSDHLIGKCSKLPQKKSDSFLNLPSPVEENKTKHLINPFTGHMEPMMSEDDEEEAAHHNVTLPARTSHMIPTGKLVECKDHPSDTDSGIGKLTNDGSSQSSSEISPVEIGHTLTVNDLITKSNDIGSCAQVDISKGALVSSTQTMAFIPTLLDQEPSVQSLNARVPTLTCDLVSESGDSLLADDRIVNVNDMLTGSIGKDLMSDQNTNTSSVVETSFVDGLLNPAPIEKHGPAVTAMSSGLGLVEGEICTLISDSACSESFEMIVDEPSKVLNDIFHHESQTNMISTLTSNLNDVQHTDVAVDGDSMLVDGPELEEMQVTVQCVEDHEPVADESSSSSAPCLINNNCNLLAEPSSNDLNVNGDDLDSKIDRSSATSLPIGVQLDHEMDGTESIEIRAEGNEMLDNLGSSQLHSVASGDHNYTSLKRNCALGYSKIGTNAKNVNI